MKKHSELLVLSLSVTAGLFAKNQYSLASPDGNTTVQITSTTSRVFMVWDN